jgi:hypothetical protein
MAESNTQRHTEMADLGIGDTFGPLNGIATVILVTAVVTPGCVIGRTARPSMPESAEGASAAPVTGSPVVSQVSPPDGDDVPPTATKPGATWVRGYWHWDGVHYTWEHGRWEPTAGATSAR